jgi:sugar/nucleoside kinase (ribokinase family)
MSLLVTGSIGIDSVTTPHGSVENVIGGSSVYFAFAATYFTPVRLVGAVGEDFPEDFRETLRRRDIDLAGLETRPGSKTFRWQGKYEGAMNEAQTLGVDLNILGEAGPKIPDAFANTDVVFLANTHPTLQREMLKQAGSPKLSVCDTMNLWIEGERDELIKTLSAVDGIIINDAEARQLTGKVNLIDVGEELLKLGSKFAVIKKGEHGALLLTSDGPTAIPAFPTRDVVDPTGAGDSFAGGMLGYLASVGDYSNESLRRGIIRGTVVSSLTIEAFSLGRLVEATREDVDRRVAEFIKMLRFD